MLRPGRGIVIAVLAALVLLTVGVVVFFTGRGQASFGWFAYAPLSEDGFRATFSGVVIWSRREAIGAGLAVLGIVTGAAAVGYAAGRRRPQRP